jgi:17 kDa outer membrane surface antigen
VDLGVYLGVYLGWQAADPERDAGTARRPSYSAGVPARPYRNAAPLCGIGLGLLLAGCAAPMAVDPMVTGSIAARPVPSAEPAPPGIPADDWAAARLALAEALRTRGSSASVPWENPSTRSHGNVTPVGAPSESASLTCQDFLMSVVRGEQDEWLSGEACRAGTGGWKIAEVRRLERS